MTTADNLKVATVEPGDTVDFDKPLPVGATCVIDVATEPKAGELAVFWDDETEEVTFRRYSGDVRTHFPAHVAGVVRQVIYSPRG